MKNIFLSYILFFSCFLWAQEVKDTAQILTGGPENSTETLTKPYVILISADGFRYDYIEKYNAKNLKKLALEGVSAKRGMYPSFPSSTFPNHYTIVTGMYPSHHGLTNNVFYDPSREEMYVIGSETIKDGSWYGGLPLWGLARENGMRSASLFWVGSESDAGGYYPNYYYPYHEEFSDDDKINIIKNWLQLPEKERPHFITLYFPEVDHNGHRFGPDAKETEEAVLFIDKAMGKLNAKLSQLGLPINFVFVSDHGMIEVEEKDYIPMPEIDEEKYKVVNSNTLASITAYQPGDILPLYKELKKNKTGKYKVYLAGEVPKNLHFSSRETDSRRIGDILLIPKGSRLLISPGKRMPTPGKHGFSPCRVPEMKAVFLAWGPAFKSDVKIGTFENIHIYPMIAEILDLHYTHPIDGRLKVLDKILK